MGYEVGYWDQVIWWLIVWRLFRLFLNSPRLSSSPDKLLVHILERVVRSFYSFELSLKVDATLPFDKFWKCFALTMVFFLICWICIFKLISLFSCSYFTEFDRFSVCEGNRIWGELEEGLFKKTMNCDFKWLC